MATWEALRLTEATMALIKSDATSKAVALALGVSKTTVCKYRREFVGRKRHYIDWPSDPAWYEVRTMSDIVAALNCRVDTASLHIKKHGYVMKKEKRRIPWPTDASWYAERTAHEIARILGVIDDQVYLHARKHGYKTKRPAMSTYDWRYGNKNSYKNARRG